MGNDTAINNANLLLLDGNAPERIQIVDECTVMGGKVMVADSVKDAILAIKDTRFSLLMVELSDTLPERRELVRRLKAHTSLKTMPILGIVSPLERASWKQWERDGVDDFLLQPINVASFRQKIMTLVVKSASPPVDKAQSESPTGGSLLDDLKRRIYNGEIELPSQPVLLQKLIDMMQDDQASLQAIGGLLEKEPAVSARVLRAANSVQFAGGNKVRTAAEALGRVGLERALNYVMMLSHDQMFKIETSPLKELREKLWRHTLTVAVASKQLGQDLSYSRPDALFAYGLLHDLGKLALLRILQSMPTKLNKSTDMVDVEAALNRLHCEFGGNVFEQWRFPEEFSQVSRYHHLPPVPAKHGKHLIIVGFCNLLAHEMEFGLTEKLIKELLQTPHAKLLKLRYQQILGLQDSVAAELQILESLM
ncbi:MAG: HDOD domain-containing protein [Gammaproteobacteria bacterium]|nr:HDOD domain-containing protein [Gammaproteobacteria bacterium]